MNTEYFIKDNKIYQTYEDSKGKKHVREFKSNLQIGCSQLERSIYMSWSHMRKRCQAKNACYSRYYYYKGIKVCEEWNNLKDGFDNFYKWSLSNGYEIGLSLDRIDSSKGYCPDNCRWITVNENRKLGLSQPHVPKWEYMAYNEKEKIALIFKKAIEFKKYTGLDERRVSDGCKNDNYEYKGWKFKRRAINLDYYKGLETIPSGSTLEDELPVEVQVIYLPIIVDEDIVHSA